MKRYFPLCLFALLLLFSSDISAQFTRTLFRKDTMSCFVSDWGRNRDLLFTVKNTSGSLKVVYPQTKLYKDDTLLIACFNPYCVLANNQQLTLSLDSILRFDGCAFYHLNCQYLFDYGRLRAGIYHFVEVLYDTLGNQLTSPDSTTFRVDGNQSAGLRYPYNNAIIYCLRPL